MKKIVTGVSLPEPLRDDLRDFARKEGISFSAFVTHLLMNAMKQLKQENHNVQS